MRDVHVLSGYCVQMQRPEAISQRRRRMFTAFAAHIGHGQQRIKSGC
jgi:hypothetical protein